MNEKSQAESATEREEVDQLLEPHRCWLRRLVAARFLDASRVDDVLQEVSLAVVQSANRPNVPEEVAAWLCRIALRQCALAGRKASRQRKLGQQRGTDLNGQIDAYMDDPVQWLIQKEECGLVRRAMALVDAESRQVLVWKYDCQLTYEEIANRLGVSKCAAEYRVLKSKKELRQHIVRIDSNCQE